MTDKYVIDQHKIMFHPERLAHWLKARDNWEEAKKFYPLYVEVSCSGLCNHRCKFCALDYLEYKTGIADFENLKKTISDMAEGGVKSIQFGGEGEPFLHPKIKELVSHAKFSGIDVSFTTNGSLLGEDILKEILPLVTWIKVSIDAATPETHLRIHRPKVQDFEIIVSNLKKAVEIKKSAGAECALGAQMLLLPDNEREAALLAKQLKAIGMDYLVIKPYSQHKKSITREYEGISYSKYLYLADELKKIESPEFQIIFRTNTMNKLNKERTYKKCHALAFFWAYLMANGDVYTCSSFLSDERFKLGNYNQKSFKEIWEGEERKKHWRFVKENFDLSECRENCRMDEINRYLEKLSNPPEHVNFI